MAGKCEVCEFKKSKLGGGVKDLPKIGSYVLNPATKPFDSISW